MSPQGEWKRGRKGKWKLDSDYYSWLISSNTSSKEVYFVAVTYLI
jgi:hypothetical protein